MDVRPAETLGKLRGWYELYLDTMRRNVVPPRPYRFVVALWELLRPQGMMQLLLAEQQGARRSRIIAGTIFLQLARTVSCAFNGSQPSDLSLRPNDMIYWEAINDACRRGFRFFDFGEVAEGRPELARYKNKWGSEPVRLYRYYYPAHRDLEVGVVEPRRYPKLLAQAVWLRLPLTATAWVGDRIYARLRLNDNIGANDLRPDISVIICTQNRASSLQVTLEHLVAADRDGIRAEVIIVDNAGHDNDKKPKRRSRFNGIARNFASFTPRAEVSVASVKVQPGHRHSLRSGFKRL